MYYNKKIHGGSTGQHQFSRAPQAKIPRSKFNRSHSHKTTFNEGFLVPIFVDEMLPGDTFKVNMNAFARLATPLFPIMDNMYLETFFFAVPNRLLWSNWEKFNGARDNPTDPLPSPGNNDFILPQLNIDAAVTPGSLADYMGIPITSGSVDPSNVKCTSLPFRAYNLIYNEWFRDEDLQSSTQVSVSDGPDNLSDYNLRRRGKRHDYFTSARPWPQKSAPITLPLGTEAPVILNPTGPGSTNGVLIRNANDNSNPISSGNSGLQTTFDTANNNCFMAIDGAARALEIDPNGSLVADLTNATAASINDLRLAFQTQKLFEKDARGGTRYTEVIQAHFGVQSPDSRLQRPEYLGGGSTPVVINPVASTVRFGSGEVPPGTPLGDLAAYGVSAPHNHGFCYSAVEHCVVIGLVCVRADLNYQQGLERMWQRRTRYDFYWPVFSHLGEQAVLNSEIYLQDSSQNAEVFGYQERYAEYRYKPSRISGLFRSAAPSSLDSWHLAQDFSTLPTLGDTFIQENAPMSRIKAVTTQPDFIFDSFFDMTCVRPMPVYSVPGWIDHF